MGGAGWCVRLGSHDLRANARNRAFRLGREMATGMPGTATCAAPAEADW